MFYSTILLAVAAFSGAVTAQSMNETGTGPQIDAGSVPYATRQQWCRTELQSCPVICGGRTASGGNTCDPVSIAISNVLRQRSAKTDSPSQNTLSYSCVCETTGMSPNVSSYEQTLPAYACREWVDQCVTNHPDDLDEITKCRDVQCGTKALEDASTSSSSSSSSSATGSATSSGSGSGASETASSTSDSESASQTSDSASASATAADSSAASALNLASTYGTGLLAFGILAAFGLAL